MRLTKNKPIWWVDKEALATRIYHRTQHENKSSNRLMSNIASILDE